MKNKSKFKTRKLISDAYLCLGKIEALLKSVDQRLASNSIKGR